MNEWGSSVWNAGSNGWSTRRQLWFCPSASPSPNSLRPLNSATPSPTATLGCIPLEWTNKNKNNNARSLWICPSASPTPVRTGASKTPSPSRVRTPPPVPKTTIYVNIHISIHIKLDPSDVLSSLRLIYLLRSALSGSLQLPTSNIWLYEIGSRATGAVAARLGQDHFLNTMNSWSNDTADARLLRGVDEATVDANLDSTIARGLVGPQDTWVSIDHNTLFAQVSEIVRRLQDVTGTADVITVNDGVPTQEDGVVLDVRVITSPVNGVDMSDAFSNSIMNALNTTSAGALLADFIASPEAADFGITSDTLDIATTDSAPQRGAGSADASGLSGGAIAGIVIGAIFGSALIGFGVITLYKKRSDTSQQSRSRSRPVSTTGNVIASADAATVAVAAGVPMESAGVGV